MERLTKLDKYGNPYTNEDINCRNLVSEDGINYQYVGYVNNFKAFDGKPIDKLFKLEDLEEELGIPLEVLFEALKEGVYAKFEENKILKSDIKLYYDLCQNGFKIRVICLEIGQYEDFEWEDYLFVKDYGKTWWLEEPKEELE